MSPDKYERLKRIDREIMNLNRKIISLQDEAKRVQLGLPEAFKFDDDFIPPFLRKQESIQ
jgi:hypothetical protein